MGEALTGVAFALALTATPATVFLWRAQKRCWEYAARQAERLPVGDPAGAAYSDMASVIALDGICSDRIPLSSVPVVPETGTDQP